MSSEVSTTTLRSARRSRLVDFLRRLLREKPLGTMGGAIILLMVFTAIFADFLAPHEMTKINIFNTLEGPSSTFWLGTDEVGSDVLSRIIYGARVSVIIGFSATALHVVVAVLIGLPSGFFGGKLDILSQRLVDAWMAFPGLLVVITIMSMAGRGTLQLVIVLGVTTGITHSRVVRSAVIAVKENLYVDAANALGCTPMGILTRHIMPNIMAPIIVIFTITIGSVIIAEAGLSFLGYGLPPDVASWGGMLNWAGRNYMEMAPGLAFWPGFVLALAVYGANMFGDAMRDLLDPRLRGSEASYGG